MTKSFVVLSAALLIVAAGFILSCQQKKSAGDTLSDDTGFTYTTEDAKRGGYLVSVSGCDDCHSPKTFGPQGPQIDESRRLSGRPADMPLPAIDTANLKSWVLFAPDLTAAVGPWGVSFSANLTSDPTGIGTWSLQQFTKAIRQGKYKGMDEGRMLLPPMPWQSLSKLTDEDIHDIFAFLKSTKPVANVVPMPIPPGGSK